MKFIFLEKGLAKKVHIPRNPDRYYYQEPVSHPPKTPSGNCGLDQLCPTQMAYWAKTHVAILTKAAHLMIY